MITLTHVGGPTVLVEVDGWQLITDPTFDPPGQRYDFGWGTSSRKLTGPAVAAADLPAIDAVLLTHDHHGDNLDQLGRTVLHTAGTVITTLPAAKRLTSEVGSVRGLAPWSTTRLEAPGRPTLDITATPCRHGPPLSRPIAGAVVGFAGIGTGGCAPPSAVARSGFVHADLVLGGRSAVRPRVERRSRRRRSPCARRRAGAAGRRRRRTR